MAQLRLKQLDSVLTGSLKVSGSAQITGSLSLQGSIFGPVDDHFDIKSDKNIRLYLDKDNDTASSKFTVLDGGGTVRLQVQEDGKTSIGGDVDATSNFVKILTGNITASGDISASGLDIAGNAEFGEYIYHKGDADTYIQFDTDEINFVVGAANMIYLNEGGAGAQADKVAINNDLADVDFQVKGDNEANLIRTVATTDRVGIGTSTPDQILNVHGNLHISGTNLGHITASGDINTTSGRVYEAGTSVIDHATAMAIVFGG